MKNPRSLSGVTICCRDVHTQSEFYRRIIGLTVVESGEKSVTLGSHGSPLIELVPAEPASTVGTAPGLYHVALRLPSRLHLGVWLRGYASCRGPGWQGASDHGVSEALYLADPEGNGIEIYRDRPRDAWHTLSDGHVTMSVEPLDVNELLAEAAPVSLESLFVSEDEASFPFSVGHVHLQVADLPAAEEFYTTTLGMHVTARFRDSAVFLAWDTYHHHIGINTWLRADRNMRNLNEPGLNAIHVTGLDRRTGVSTTKHQYESCVDPSGVRIIHQQGV